MGLILSRLCEEAGHTRAQDALTTELHTALLDFRDRLQAGETPEAILPALIAARQAEIKRAKEAGQLDKESRNLFQRQIGVLEDYRRRLAEEGLTDSASAMEAIRGWFGEEVERRRALGEETGKLFDNAFRFLEQTFGAGQELVIFVTEITAGYDTSWFVENFGCDAYFRHNRELLFDNTRHRIQEEIAAAKAAQREEDPHGGEPKTN